MKIRKLLNMPYANARVYEFRKEDDGFNMDVLVSYSTPVVVVNYTFKVVSCLGLYSRTTRKHISEFMREKGMYYDIAKECYETNRDYNFDKRKFLPRPV